MIVSLTLQIFMLSPLLFVFSLFPSDSSRGMNALGDSVICSFYCFESNLRCIWPKTASRGQALRIFLLFQCAISRETLMEASLYIYSKQVKDLR